MYQLRTSYLGWKYKISVKYVQPILGISTSQKVKHNESKRKVVMKPHETATLRVEAPVFSITKAIIQSPTIIEDKLESKKPVTVDNAKWKEMQIDTKQLGKYYLKLSKFRLTSLVVITSMGGYVMATAPFDPATFLFCAIGTGLLSSAANSINQFLEIPFDAQMSRTRSRVLVQGNLSPLHAIGFAAAAGSVGLLTLYLGTNGLTAALGAANFVLYTTVYTPLKRISILNTWVGSVVGAVPPLMGWAACQGSLEAGAFIMAGLLYAWQFPHFNALSWNLRPDYSRAGYRMMAVTNPGLCRRTALRYTLGITALSSLAPVLDVTNWHFAVFSLPLNLYFTYLAVQFYKESDSKSSRSLFRFSLLHLPLLMGLLLFTKKNWNFTSKNLGNTDNTEKLDALVTKDALLLVKNFVMQIRPVEDVSNSNFNPLAVSVPVSNVPLNISEGR